MLRIAAIALAVLSLAGCAAPSYTFEGEWTPGEKADVMAGVAAWPVGKTTTFYRVDDTNAFAPECIVPDGITPAGAVGYAWTSSDSSHSWTCFYMSALTGASLERIAAHETGHRLGLEHSVDGDPASIMRADYTQDADAPTAWDIANMNAVQK